MSLIRDRLTTNGKTATPPDVQDRQEPAAGENILVVQSAHPDLVLRALQGFAENPIFVHPRYTLFCANKPEILEFFRDHPMLSGIRCHSGARTAWQVLKALRREKYDSLVLFLSREPGHWKIKLFAFLLGARHKLIFNENNDCFYFTWSAALAMMRNRLKDHWHASGPNRTRRMRAFLIAPLALLHGRRKQNTVDAYPGERILVLQSAEPPSVLRALDRMRATPLFTNPRYTLFCRDFPEVLEQFKSHPMLYEVHRHARTQNSGSHLRSLRREHFDAVVLFLTGDPGYWKIKCFAFLLGARHKLIFNENNDCFFFHWKAWAGLLAHRMASRSKVPAHAGGAHQIAGVFLILIKLLLFPFRFAWLLLVWGQLRWSAMRASN